MVRLLYGGVVTTVENSYFCILQTLTKYCVPVGTYVVEVIDDERVSVTKTKYP